MNTPEQRSAYTAGLRHLAELLDDNPGIPLPLGHTSNNHIVILFPSSKEPRAAMAEAARVFPCTWTKNAGEDFFDLNGKLAGLNIELSAPREAVCTRRVTGTREVTREVPDPDLLARVPMVEVTETVEDVEWDCGPILAGGERVATAAEKADDAARMERARRGTTAGSAPVAFTAPQPAVPAAQDGVVWKGGGQPPTTAEQDKAAFENAGHCGSPA